MANNRVKKYQKIINSSPLENSAKPTNAHVTANDSKRMAEDPILNAANNADTNGTNFLSSLLNARIFFNYFEYVANKTYRGDGVEQKVIKLKTAHPLFHSACIAADLFVVGIAILILITAAGCAVFKVILG